MSISTTFADLKVQTKVWSGFGLVLATLAVVGGLGVIALTRISSSFDIFLQRTEVLAVADEIEIDFTTLRRHTREFALTGNEATATEAQKMAKQVKDRVSRGLALIREPERRKKLEEIQTLSADYIRNFDQVVALKKEERNLTVETLDPTGLKLRQDFGQLAAAAVRTGNSNGQISALTGTEALMVARLDVNKALARHSAAAFESAESSFARYSENLKSLEAVTRSPELKPLYDEIKALTDKYYATFRKVSGLSDQINKLVNGEMSEEGRKIAEDAEAIKHSAQSEQTTISESLHSLISNSTTTSVILVVVGVALGFAFAWFIGRGIAGPVLGMTNAMQKLAGGDKMAAIPGVGRKDEIGAMAGAVQVFKDNMIRADQLADEQRAEQEKKELRQKAIETYIGQFDQMISDSLKQLGSASSEMRSAAQSMSATAEETSRQSTAVAAASEEASTNVQTVAAASEELSSSIAEISRQVAQSTKITTKAVEEANRTNASVQGLAEAAQKIGDVVQLINDIAAQTNLLALNATIEAARAGEAGKGFAVVASEVKSLANQTAKATEEIGAQISAIQNATKDSVEAIKGIGATITEVNQIAASIASAVEQQGAATQEIARNVQQAAAGTSEVSTNITGVTQAAGETGSAATQVLGAAGDLAKQSETLRSEVDRFLANIRAA